MGYEVRINKKSLKNLKKLPDFIQDKFWVLINDLEENGPIQSSWSNFSKLSIDTYHCHLSRKYVACWYYKEKKIIVEVYYVGSRENAPY